MINKDKQLDELINQSMQIKDAPSAELNHNLKEKLYQQEKILKQNTSTYTISLWYFPMVLNFILFGLLSVCTFLFITNLYIAIFVSIICANISLAGIVISLVGIKRTKMKENMSVHVQNRGVIA